MEPAWGLELQMKQHEKLQSAGNPWAQHVMLMWLLTKQRMGAPSILPRACPLEQERVISKDGGACFYLNILPSFINTCGVGGLHVLETMSPATQIKSAPSQRITESKSLCLTSSLAQDISVEVLLKLSVIPC